MVDERVRIIEELHRRFAGVLYDKCLRILGDQADAEDALQETFISAVRALHTFEERGFGHLPWLYRIATNACLKLIRGRQAQKGERSKEPASGRTDLADALHVREALSRLVQQLDERSMEILVAYYVDGVDQGEIARQMGISRRAVVKRLTAMRSMVGHLVERRSE